MRICGSVIGVVVGCKEVVSIVGIVGTSILLYVLTRGGILCLVGLNFQIAIIIAGSF